MSVKRDVAKLLRDLAESLPLIFEWKEEPTKFTGEELNLTPYGDSTTFDKTSIYELPMPVMVAVEHRMQLKDCWKRGGLEAVKEYCTKVKQQFLMMQPNLGIDEFGAEEVNKWLTV